MHTSSPLRSVTASAPCRLLGGRTRGMPPPPPAVPGRAAEPGRRAALVGRLWIVVEITAEMTAVFFPAALEGRRLPPPPREPGRAE